MQININDAITYDGLAGGVSYLVAHEISHDTAGGIAESNAMWQEYLKEPGISTMTNDQQVSNYPNSTEFKTNEQWANSGGRDITNALGVSNLPNPTNGFYSPPPPPSGG